VQIQRAGTGTVQVTLHAYELVTLVAAARWVVEGARGELTADAVEQVKSVLERYDRACARS